MASIDEDISRVVRLPCASGILAGDLAIVPAAQGVVLFVPVAGSSRHSRRKRVLSKFLQRAGFATLLLDLMTEQEEADLASGKWQLDIPLLAKRLSCVTQWVRGRPDLRDLPVGYFASDSGTSVALLAAAEKPDDVSAIVSRSGYFELSSDALARVAAPTLLIVGEQDAPAIKGNKKILALLTCEKELKIIEAAGHSFDEAGALNLVGHAARDHFSRCFCGAQSGN